MPAKPFDPGFAHLALVVDDIDALLVRIAVHGWKAQGTPQPIASGARAGTRVIYAVGPDGATIEFIAAASDRPGSLIPLGEGPLPTSSGPAYGQPNQGGPTNPAPPPVGLPPDHLPQGRPGRPGEGRRRG